MFLFFSLRQNAVYFFASCKRLEGRAWYFEQGDTALKYLLLFFPSFLVK